VVGAPEAFAHGRLVRLDARGTPAAGLTFPLNPASLQRSLGRSEAGRPEETVRFTLPLDLLAPTVARDPSDAGLHPELAVLEGLLHAPRDGGVTVLVWGSRVVPVEVLGLQVHETRFDPALAPLQAQVEVTLAVLTDDRSRGPAAELLRAHRAWQGKLAAAVAVPAVAQRGGPSGAPGT
jgi:hypothetical protein